MFLEKQIQKVDGIVSGFEEQLAKDGTILDQPNKLSGRSQQLQVTCLVMQKRHISNSFRIGSYDGIESMTLQEDPNYSRLFFH